MMDFRGRAVLGLDIEFLALVGERVEFCPFAVLGARSVFSLGKAWASFSRDSGGDLAGKLMTCSRKGAE